MLVVMQNTMVKILSFYIFSISMLVGFGQDTINTSSVHCPVKLQQICPHINNTYIGLDYSNKLVLLDSSFSLISYGPAIQYVNLNDYHSPLQIIALNNDNQIIYLDQKLNINRVVTPPNADFIHFVSINRKLGLWIPLNDEIVLFDPNFKIITQQFLYPNTNNIVKITCIKDEILITEKDYSYLYRNNRLSKTPNYLKGTFISEADIFSYNKHNLWIETKNTITHSFLTRDIQFIHVNKKTLLILDTNGGLSKHTL